MPVYLADEIARRLAEPLTQILQEANIDERAELVPPGRKMTRGPSLACHRFARHFRKSPQQIAQDFAQALSVEPGVASVNPINGFLNIRLNWSALAQEVVSWALNDEAAIGVAEDLTGQHIVIEYSSPNTNKPLHLGHCRNNVLGMVTANLLESVGAQVTRVNLINDRGIHICKSMAAYAAFGEGKTPSDLGKKGDHLVGDFYVRFDAEFKREYDAYCGRMDEPMDKDQFFNSAESEWGQTARQMLVDWENEDPKVRALWVKMNGWCETGFAETYERMGVRFDRVYKESETYLLGKDLIEDGLKGGVFQRAANGAVVFPLEKMGLEGEKSGSACRRNERVYDPGYWDGDGEIYRAEF